MCKNGHLVIQTNKAKTNPIKAKTNPIQTQFDERPKLMQSEYLQRVMMIKPYCGFVKTNPIKANFKRQISVFSFLFSLVLRPSSVIRRSFSDEAQIIEFSDEFW